MFQSKYNKMNWETIPTEFIFNQFKNFSTQIHINKFIYDVTGSACCAIFREYFHCFILNKVSNKLDFRLMKEKQNYFI